MPKKGLKRKEPTSSSPEVHYPAPQPTPSLVANNAQTGTRKNRAQQSLKVINHPDIILAYIEPSVKKASSRQSNAFARVPGLRQLNNLKLYHPRKSKVVLITDDSNPYQENNNEYRKKLALHCAGYFEIVKRHYNLDPSFKFPEASEKEIKKVLKAFNRQFKGQLELSESSASELITVLTGLVNEKEGKEDNSEADIIGPLPPLSELESNISDDDLLSNSVEGPFSTDEEKESRSSSILSLDELMLPRQAPEKNSEFNIFPPEFYYDSREYKENDVNQILVQNEELAIEDQGLTLPLSPPTLFRQHSSCLSEGCFSSKTNLSQTYASFFAPTHLSSSSLDPSLPLAMKDQVDGEKEQILPGLPLIN